MGHCSNEFQSRVLSPKIVPDTQFVFQLLLSPEIYLLEVEKPSIFIKIPMKFPLFVTKGFCCFGEARFSRRDISELRRSWKTNWVSGTIFGDSTLDWNSLEQCPISSNIISKVVLFFSLGARFLEKRYMKPVIWEWLWRGGVQQILWASISRRARIPSKMCFSANIDQMLVF